MMPPEEPRRELRRMPLLGGSMSFKEGALSYASFVARQILRKHLLGTLVNIPS
jgi:hypothetical protein